MNLVIKEITSNLPMALPLTDRILLIGNSPDCDIFLPDSFKTENILKIEPIDQTYNLSVLGKTKAILNGQKVSTARIVPGDRIEWNSHIFIVELESSCEMVAENNKDISRKIDRLIGAIGTERNLKKLLENLLSILSEITGGSDIFIFILNHSERPQLFVSSNKASSEERFSDTIIQSVISSKEGIFIPHALSDPKFNSTQSIIDLQLQSIMCSPIKVANRILGLIYIGSKNPAISYTAADLQNLSLYCTIAGMLINHLEYFSQQKELVRKLSGSTSIQGLITESKPMQNVVSAVFSIASTDISVLLEGETGTGKSRIAQIIHDNSNRSNKPFFVVNCSSLKGELLESELFGHKKGSFTGAVADHSGLFTAADCGTLFLDEIGELDIQLQAKLLRVLETGQIRPLGSSQESTVDVRIICATNRNLLKMIEESRFRADLYYRINQFSITIPPLRERPEDLQLLASSILEQYKAQYPQKDIFDFHPDMLEYIQNYSWPGNVRELQNCIHRSVILSKTPLITLCPHSGNQTAHQEDFESATKSFQRELIKKTILLTKGNKDEAARQLGLSRSTFFRYQSQLGLSDQ